MPHVLIPFLSRSIAARPRSVQYSDDSGPCRRQGFTPARPTRIGSVASCAVKFCAPTSFCSRRCRQGHRREARSRGSRPIGARFRRDAVSDASAVGTEDDRVSGHGHGRRFHAGFGRFRIPDLRVAVVRGCDDAQSVRAERGARHRSGMAVELMQHLAGFNVPYPGKAAGSAVRDVCHPDLTPSSTGAAARACDVRNSAPVRCPKRGVVAGAVGDTLAIGADGRRTELPSLFFSSRTSVPLNCVPDRRVLAEDEDDVRIGAIGYESRTKDAAGAAQLASRG